MREWVIGHVWYWVYCRPIKRDASGYLFGFWRQRWHRCIDAPARRYNAPMESALGHTISLLGVAILVAMLARRLSLPYTVGLVVTGIGLAVTRLETGADHRTSWSPSRRRSTAITIISFRLLSGSRTTEIVIAR
jgi:hypothetical protein